MANKPDLVAMYYHLVELRRQGYTAGVHARAHDLVQAMDRQGRFVVYLPDGKCFTSDTVVRWFFEASAQLWRR